MSTALFEQERLRAADVWSIWYAARFGKVERVRFLLDHKKLEIDASEQVGD